MSQQIRQLKDGTTLIFPLTSAESVLVKQNNKVITLNDYLNRTIITPNTKPEAVKVQYDRQGHIVVTEPVSKQSMIVNNQKYAEYNGESEVVIQLGDDFQIQDSNITLTWGDDIN